jgi:hypothetical protein
MPHLLLHPHSARRTPARRAAARPGRRQRHHGAGAGRPRRRGRRLRRHHERQRAAATDRPGDRPDLPRPDHQVGRPRHPSPAWAAAVGTGRSLRWPVGIGADGNAGVAAQIGRIPYSIGSTERSFVTGTTVGSAAIQNRSGNYVLPTTAAITADAAGRPDITQPASPSSTNPARPATPSAATAGSCSPPASQARQKERPSPRSSAGSPTRGRPTPPPSATSPCPRPSGTSPPPPSPASPAPPDSHSPADRLSGAPDAPGRPFKAGRLGLRIVSVTATVPHVTALRLP